MKTLLTTALLGLSLISFAQSSEIDMRGLGWLEGSWVRTNARPGKSGVEKWTRISDVEFKGKGINLTGTDTTFIEQLSIIKKDNKVYYVADVPGNQSEVYFELVSQSATGFICENLNHDFPKRINYEKDGVKLKVIISGNDKSFEILFEKKSEGR
jgi:hypothetical protein